VKEENKIGSYSTQELGLETGEQKRINNYPKNVITIR